MRRRPAGDNPAGFRGNRCTPAALPSGGGRMDRFWRAPQAMCHARSSRLSSRLRAVPPLWSPGPGSRGALGPRAPQVLPEMRQPGFRCTLGVEYGQATGQRDPLRRRRAVETLSGLRRSGAVHEAFCPPRGYYRSASGRSHFSRWLPCAPQNRHVSLARAQISRCSSRVRPRRSIALSKPLAVVRRPRPRPKFNSGCGCLIGVLLAYQGYSERRRGSSYTGASMRADSNSATASARKSAMRHSRIRAPAAPRVKSGRLVQYPAPACALGAPRRTL